MTGMQSLILTVKTMRATGWHTIILLGIAEKHHLSIFRDVAMVPKDNHDVFVGQTDSRGENMPLLPPRPQGFLGLLALDSCCAVIEWHCMLKWSAGISYYLLTSLSNAKHLKQKNCIMDYDKVHGGMMYLCCDDILWARSSLGALKWASEIRRVWEPSNWSEQHTNHGLFKKINI